MRIRNHQGPLTGDSGDFLAYESDKERAIQLVCKRVPVTEGELAEAVAEVSGNEFVGTGMGPAT